MAIDKSDVPDEAFESYQTIDEKVELTDDRHIIVTVFLCKNTSIVYTLIKLYRMENYVEEHGGGILRSAQMEVKTRSKHVATAKVYSRDVKNALKTTRNKLLDKIHDKRMEQQSEETKEQNVRTHIKNINFDKLASVPLPE